MGDWSDVIDLDFDQPELWDYLIETLVGWARIVDGFRCDVASLEPVAFWEQARTAEDGDEGNDVWETFERWLDGAAPLSHLLDLLDFQQAAYPAGFNKLRFLENHDQPRIASRVTDEAALRALTALSYFLPGTTLVYAGQEVGADHVPTLFDRDPVDWTVRCDLAPLMRQLSAIKHSKLDGRDLVRYVADDAHDIALVYRDAPAAGPSAAAGVPAADDVFRHYLGIFPLRGRGANVAVDLPDGTYHDLLSEKDVAVADGRLTCGSSPLILDSCSAAEAATRR